MNTFWDVFWERREELLKLFVEHMEMTSTAVLVLSLIHIYPPRQGTGSGEPSTAGLR